MVGLIAVGPAAFAQTAPAGSSPPGTAVVPATGPAVPLSGPLPTQVLTIPTDSTAAKATTSTTVCESIPASIVFFGVPLTIDKPTGVVTFTVTSIDKGELAPAQAVAVHFGDDAHYLKLERSYKVLARVEPAGIVSQVHHDDCGTAWTKFATGEEIDTGIFTRMRHHWKRVAWYVLGPAVGAIAVLFVLSRPGAVWTWARSVKVRRWHWWQWFKRR